MTEEELQFLTRVARLPANERNDGGLGKSPSADASNVLRLLRGEQAGGTCARAWLSAVLNEAKQ